MAPHKKDRRRNLRSLYIWHRWFGVTCAALILWLAVTGLALNHSPLLGLNRSYITAPWVLRAYGMRIEAPARGFAIAENWVSQSGDALFLDVSPVTDWRETLVGVVGIEQLIFAASARDAALLTLDGKVIERLGPTVLPGLVTAVASTESLILIRTHEAVFSSTVDLLDFVPYQGPWPQTQARPQALPAPIAAGIVAAGAGLRISQERVLADLHSGRLLGTYGPLVMDLAALGFIFLALTGLWLWLRFRRSQRLRDARQKLYS